MGLGWKVRYLRTFPEAPRNVRFQAVSRRTGCLSQHKIAIYFVIYPVQEAEITGKRLL